MGEKNINHSSSFLENAPFIFKKFFVVLIVFRSSGNSKKMFTVVNFIPFIKYNSLTFSHVEWNEKIMAILRTSNIRIATRNAEYTNYDSAYKKKLVVNFFYCKTILLFMKNHE